MQSLISLVLAGGLTVFCSAAVQPAWAETFRSERFGYVIEVPAGWVRVPLEVVARRAQELLGATGAADTQTEAVFQPADAGSELGYPFLHLKAQTYAETSWPRQPYDDELPAFLDGLRQLDVGALLAQVLSPAAREQLRSASLLDVALDPDQRRYSLTLEINRETVGPVLGYIDGYFGRQALVKVLFQTRKEQADQYTAIRSALRESFRFDADQAFVPGVSPEPAESGWQRTAVRLGIAAVILVLIFGVKGRRKNRAESRGPRAE